MDLKWIRKEIIKESISCGKRIAGFTGKYEMVLHQRFVDEKGDSHWQEIPTE